MHICENTCKSMISFDRWSNAIILNAQALTFIAPLLFRLACWQVGLLCLFHFMGVSQQASWKFPRWRSALLWSRVYRNYNHFQKNECKENIFLLQIFNSPNKMVLKI